MIKKFKKLKEGAKRAIIAGTLIGAPLLGVVFFLIEGSSIDGADELISASLFFGVPAYWLMVFIGIWVYEGFKEEPKNNMHY